MCDKKWTNRQKGTGLMDSSAEQSREEKCMSWHCRIDCPDDGSLSIDQSIFVTQHEAGCNGEFS